MRRPEPASPAPATCGLAAAVGVAGALLLAGGPAVAQQEVVSEGEVTATRVAGPDRYATAAAAAEMAWETAPEAVIASGEAFPDALAASFAAGAAGEAPRPLLLTAAAALPPSTEAALDALAVERVFVIGGTAAVAPDVVAELEQRGHEVARVDGIDRYHTAAGVAVSWGGGATGEVGALDGDRTALLASGEAFADALAASPVAARGPFPLLLTPPEIPHAAVDGALEELGIERLVVVGGEAAVSDGVADHYRQRGYETERWHGSGRTETAAVVADHARRRLGFGSSRALLARGDDFADALAGGVHGGADGSPLLLAADPDTLGTPTTGWLSERCPEIERLHAFGGPGAVTDGVLEDAVEAASACVAAAPANNQSYIVSPQEPVRVEPGREQRFRLPGTYDGGPREPGALALFPCDAVDRDGSFVTFAEDPDLSGVASGSAETDTGAAWISAVDGVTQPDRSARHRDLDGDTENFHVASDAPDCAVPVVWDTADEHPGELPIDAGGEPTVRFGVGEIRWADDDPRVAAR